MKTKYLLLLLFLSVGCDKKGPTPSPEPLPPKTAILISPLLNEVCTSGTIISDQESTITFKWSPAENAESYELSYKNLETGASTSLNTVNTTINLNLTRNTPYSWKVIAKSSKTSLVSTSEVWKFYNAGLGITSYAPYPAELSSPSLGANVTPVSGKISLIWKGADADGDITGYILYFGTDANPPLFKSDLTTSALADVPVNNNTTYYWKIVTKDAKGNTSDSAIGQFKTN